MPSSHFDLLSAGAGPEETRRLFKMLREWSDADENGFPAQWALLTRAQWRVAATVPESVVAARMGLEQRFTEMQTGIGLRIVEAESALRARAEDHQNRVATQFLTT